MISHINEILDIVKFESKMN